MRRSLAMTIAAAAAALALAGCGGGGGGAAADDEAPPVDTTLPAAQGASSAASAAEALAALGQPIAVEASEIAETLDRLEQFGPPRDIFEQLVDEAGGGGTAVAEADTGDAGGVVVPSAPPTVTPDPAVALPSPSTGSGGTPPASEAPSALEADFDIDGEPVVAREGDAVPPDTQRFEVASISATRVVLTLVGGLLPDGTDTVRMSVGQSITLDNQTSGTSTTIKLVQIRAA